MSKRTLRIALGAAVAGVLAIAGAVVAAPRADAAPASGERTPVLVELFTSEGCSSCPPADDVASRIARGQPVPGAQAIVVAHHVDYWNELGWTDPFSSSAATARQQRYALLGGGSYTPQVVVDGRAQIVGSRGAAIEEAIASSAKQPHAKIELAAAPASPGVFDVTMKLGPIPGATSGDVDVVLAVVQDRGRVRVPRGENAGRTLEHVAIARSVEVIGGLPPAGGTLKRSISAPRVIDAPEGSTFSVAVFAQERGSRRIVGAATSPLALRSP